MAEVVPGPPGEESPPARGPSRLRSARRVALLVVVAAVVMQGASAIIRPRGDFLNHVEWGRRLLAGRFLYEGGLNIPYTPTWALAHVPFTFLPTRVAVGLAFAIGLFCCGLLLALLHRVSRGTLPREELFWVDLAALCLASRFLLRDLADGGPNLVLLALVWMGFYLWTEGQDARGGALIGLATALKGTPGLFLLWLAFRRQGKAVVAGASALVVFTLLPELWMGLPSWKHHMSVWAGNVSAGITSRDARIGVLGLEPDRNLALRPVVGRLLGRSPFAPSPETVVLAGWAAALALTALCAFRFRRRPASRHDPRLSLELATVGLLAILLSPVTWRSHAVAALPALFLLLRRHTGRLAESRPLVVLLSAWVLVFLVLNRVVAGSYVVGLLEASGLYTLLLLALLGALLAEVKPPSPPGPEGCRPGPS